MLGDSATVECASVLANSFVLLYFLDQKDANSIVHELSKYLLYSNISYFCKCVSLPLAVMEAWESNVDIPSFCSFNEIFTFIHTQKKKEKVVYSSQ